MIRQKIVGITFQDKYHGTLWRQKGRHRIEVGNFTANLKGDINLGLKKEVNK